MVYYSRGSNVLLTCALEAEAEEVDADGSDYSVAWYCDNVPMKAATNGSLVLNSIDIRDGGWYTCATSSNTRRFELDFLIVVGGEILLVYYIALFIPT